MTSIFNQRTFPIILIVKDVNFVNHRDTTCGKFQKHVTVINTFLNIKRNAARLYLAAFARKAALFEGDLEIKCAKKNGAVGRD